MGLSSEGAVAKEGRLELLLVVAFLAPARPDALDRLVSLLHSVYEGEEGLEIRDEVACFFHPLVDPDVFEAALPSLFDDLDQEGFGALCHG